jgi:hypothetical protein
MSVFGELANLLIRPQKDAGFEDTFASRFGAAPLEPAEAAALRQRQFVNRQQGEGAPRAERVLGGLADLSRSLGEPVTRIADYSRSRVGTEAPVTEEDVFRQDLASRNIGKGIAQAGAYGLPVRNPLGAVGQIEARGGTLYANTPKVLPMDEAARAARAVAQNRTLDAYHGTRAPTEIRQFETGNIYSDTGELLHAYSGHPNSLIGPHSAAEPQVANKFAMGEGVDWLKTRFAEGNPAVYPLKLDATKVQKFKREEDLDTLLFRQNVNAREVEDVIAQRFDDVEEGFAKYDRDKAFREQVNREAVRNENNYDEPSTEVGQALADAVRHRYERAGVTTIQYPNAVEGGTSYISIAPPRSRFATFDPARSSSSDLLASLATLGATGFGTLAAQDNYQQRD